MRVSQFALRVPQCGTAFAPKLHVSEFLCIQVDRFFSEMMLHRFENNRCALSFHL